MLRATRLWSAAALAAIAVQLVALYAPSVPQVGAPAGTDKVVHLLIFAAPTALALLAGWSRRWVVVAFAAQGLVSEIVQAQLLSHRDGDLRDLLTDLAGVLVGVLAARALSRRPAPA